MREVVPYQVHTVLADNGIQFAGQARNRSTIYFLPMRFDMIREANGIGNRLTKPWSEAGRTPSPPGARPPVAPP